MALARPIRAGQLRHRLTIQTPSAGSADAYGYGAVSWSTHVTRWGMVEPLTGREFYEARQVDSDVTHRVLLRSTDGITTGMRVRMPQATGSTGELYARDTVEGGAGTAWTTPDNILDADAVSSSVVSLADSASSRRLYAIDFRFRDVFPANIDSIVAVSVSAVAAIANGSGVTMNARLRYDGSDILLATADQTVPQSVAANLTFGGTSDMSAWGGGSLTVDQAKSDSFGVGILVTNNGGALRNIQVDAVGCDIYYMSSRKLNVLSVVNVEERGWRSELRCTEAV